MRSRSEGAHSAKSTEGALKISAILPVALAVMAAFVWQWAAHSSPRGGAAVTPVSTTTVSLKGAHDVLRLSGAIAALDSVTLTAPRILGSRSALNRGGDFNSGGSGPGGGAAADFNLVLLSLAKPGTRVKAGDIVARFDAQNQQQRLDDYRDSVVQLENNTRTLMSNLAATKEAQDQTVRTAKAAWDQALLDLNSAPVLSQIEAERRRLTAEEAEAAYKQVLQEVAFLEQQQQAQIRSSELNREQSGKELQRAEANVGRMTVRAPIDGIVVMSSIVRNGEFAQISEGDQVNAGQPFMSIVNPDKIVLNANVNQVDAERVRIGMRATVSVDAYPGINLPGLVTGMGAMAVASTARAGYLGQIPVRIMIEGTDPHLIPDLTGSAEIRLTTSGRPT